MFSSITRRIGTRFLDRLDLLVEFSTLGEYGIDGEGLFALDSEACPAARRERAGAAGSPGGHVAPVTQGAPLVQRSRDDCPHGDRLSPSCRGAAARP